MNYKDICEEYAQILDTARKIMKPACYVCKVCNGVACGGRSTTTLEMGGKGSGSGFYNSFNALSKIRIDLDIIHEDFIPDTSTDMFGKKFALPVFAAPIGKLLVYKQLESPYFNNNAAYADALVGGTSAAGGMAWLGDAADDSYICGQLEAVKNANGMGIPTIKPWGDKAEVMKRVRWAQDAGAIAIATDLDAIGLGYQSASSKPIRTKTLDDLRELTGSVKEPVIFKGIMSVKSAIKAAEAGAYGILISNHGGNIIENSLSPSDVLPDIKKAVGDSIKILVDGAIRTGEDVFKVLALGADAALIGRPYVVSVYGGGKEGAMLYTEKIRWELQNIMRLANCRNLKEITIEKIIIKR